ncbi:MAG TPA: 50S ribosomal protein L10 [Bacillota bacterium]|nr:50S ribosomal protein L10 [Bacillota bacterium]HPJ23668.1 50S ribosomal protein L10 [Bacillota bacterium]
MANQNIIDLKAQEVEKITEKMSSAKSVVIAEYRGLTVEKAEQLRRQLREEGCEMMVIKNNISRRAARNVGYETLSGDFKGPNGIVFAFNDSVAAAKVLHTFAKKNPKLVIKSGVVDGDYYEPAQIKEIATLPSKEVLLAMFATQLYAPLRDLAIGLDLLTKNETESSEESN